VRRISASVWLRCQAVSRIVPSMLALIIAIALGVALAPYILGILGWGLGIVVLIIGIALSAFLGWAILKPILGGAIDLAGLVAKLVIHPRQQLKAMREERDWRRRKRAYYKRR